MHLNKPKEVLFLPENKCIAGLAVLNGELFVVRDKSLKVAKADTDKDDKAGASKGTDVPKLGLTVAPANSVAGAGKDGVVVTEVDPKSAAAERGFKEGDVILEVAGKSVTTAGDVREAVNAARSDNKNSVLMRVKSGGSSRFVAVPLAKG